VIEQEVGSKFNRAMLMNIGYAEAIKDHDWQCFIFHDVDLLPENDRNIYSCPESPRHMSAAIDTMGYKLPYSAIFGGVSALTKEQFVKVNGFSNKFFGWGGEDDDMFNRIRKKGYKLIRYPMNIARYSMIKHKKQDANPLRFHFLNGGTSRMALDGINSLKYKLVKTERLKLFTKIIVVINQDEVMIRPR
jgi:GT2 family glycosyltransferase